MTDTQASQRHTCQKHALEPSTAMQTLILDRFPSTAAVRLLGPNSGHGNRYAVSACRQFVKGWAYLEARRQGIRPVQPPVDVTLRYVFADNRARDVDNFAMIGKPILDGLVKAGILEGDDAKRLREQVVFVVEKHARRLEVVLAPAGRQDGEDEER
jgi:hypothetical protein